MGKNDVVDITTMYGKFKDVTELTQQFNLQSRALNTAYDRIKELEEENETLRQQIATTPKNEIVLNEPVSSFLVPTEERLCKNEIEKLEQVAQERSLTFEETKRLDILIKNLYLAREKNKVIEGSATKVKELTDADLLAIAEQE